MNSGILTVTLKSDLCVGSGDGFSSGIDTDCCYDVCGIPFIPGRRLKGCLRDAAELISKDSKKINEIFGVKGMGYSNSFVICDARIEDYDDVIRKIENGFPKEIIIDYYTRIKVNTAIENNQVVDGSLRFSRVVNHYVPCIERNCDEYKELKFTAKVFWSEELEKKWQIVKEFNKFAKALRNIGLNRNRGLGAIKCAFEKNPYVNNKINVIYEDKLLDESSDVTVAYAVRLDSAMMIPNQNSNESLDYIPGSSVYGFFASALKNTAEFNDLFFKNKVKFSPLYPVDDDGKRCIPALPLLTKLKLTKNNDDIYYKDGSIVYVDCIENIIDGVQKKPIKQSFISKNKPEAVDVATEIIYHNPKNNNQGLYTQKCISNNQAFVGFISGNKDLIVNKIIPVLESDFLSFGRSKTAQYAKCSLINAECFSRKYNKFRLETEKKYSFMLDSDTLICKDGRYLPNIDNLKEEIYSKLIIFTHKSKENITDLLSFDFDDDNATKDEPILSNLNYRVISGYNAKWNHKKPHIRALAAGSCLFFTVREDVEIPSEFYIGERNGEGYGRVLVLDKQLYGKLESNENMNKKSGNEKECKSKDEVNNKDNKFTTNSNNQLICYFDKQEKLALLKDEYIKKAKEYKANLKDEYAKKAKEHKSDNFKIKVINNTLISKLVQMVEESQNESDLKSRFKSIKNPIKQDTIHKFIEQCEDLLNNNHFEWTEKKEVLVLYFGILKYYLKIVNTELELLLKKGDSNE